ncbi:MAG TPA: CoA ester lyase [Nocardioidaceae bacterium]|nr:CoA ester lyase [Nocardioidaceae bacterium]
MNASVGGTVSADGLPWRSMLFVPVTEERFVAKAASVGADACQLDLEDSIAATAKEKARAALPEAVGRLSGAGCEVVLRINRPLRLAIRDLEAVALPGVRALAVPKVDSPGHLRLIDETLGELEAERGLPVGGIRLIAMIESPGALLRAGAIAQCSARLCGLTLGGEDFALADGVRPDPDVMTGPLQHVVHAATAAGLWPLGLAGSISDYRDLDAFRQIARLSRRTGCVGASAIHPAQVPVLNEEFTPAADDVERARRLLATFDESVRGGVGAVGFEGTMVDEPVARRARALVAAADAFAARDAARA